MDEMNKNFGKLRDEMRAKVFLKNNISQKVLNKNPYSNNRPAKGSNFTLKTALAASIITVAISASLLSIPIKGTTGEVSTGWHYVTEGAHKLLAGWLTPGDINQPQQTGWLNPTNYFVDSEGTQTKFLTYYDTFAPNGPGNVKIELEYGNRNGEIILFTNPAKTPEVLIPSPGLDSYAFSSVGGSLWLIDSKTLELKQLVGDIVGQYDRKAIVEKIYIPGADTYQPHLYWAMDPHWSPDGKYIAYVSNRDLQHREPKGTQKIGMELWIVEVQTGKNTLVYQDPEQALHLLGWSKDGQVLLRTASRDKGGFVAIDTVSKEGHTLREGNIVFDGVSPDGTKALFFKVSSENIVQSADPYILDLKTGEDYKLPSAGSEDYTMEMLFSPNGTKIFAVRQDFSGKQTVTVLNADKSGILQSFTPPQGETVYQNMSSWIDDDKILVVTSSRGTPDNYNTWVLSVN